MRKGLVERTIAEGTSRVIDGHRRVYFGGYWIKAYEVPADTLRAKKQLIHALTLRLFKHVEYGLNVPGRRLGEARAAFEGETDAAKRRIKGAMLAGALFNRAADIFTKLVEVQGLGVEIKPDNALMRECGEHLKEALTLGKMVLHRSGDEGIDELWGEPFKAFCYPIEEFYRSRYIKIALTMSAIDDIARRLIASFEVLPAFHGIGALIINYAERAKVKCETLRTDDDIFDVWAAFVVAGEQLSAFEPIVPTSSSLFQRQQIAEGVELVRCGKTLVMDIVRARVPMPKSTREYLARCETYAAGFKSDGPLSYGAVGDGPVAHCPAVDLRVS